eukprot:scaffold1722_cov120-Cylindrotheca_fusiformis.AAC.8
MSGHHTGRAVARLHGARTNPPIISRKTQSATARFQFVDTFALASCKLQYDPNRHSVKSGTMSFCHVDSCLPDRSQTNKR